MFIILKSWIVADSWRAAFLGLLLAAVLFTVGFEVAAFQGWKSYSDIRMWRGDLSFAFLAEPIGKDKTGQAITRGAVLDALVKQALSPPAGK